MNVRIRWMVGGDIKEVARLEKKFSPRQLSETALKQLLYREAVTAVVAEVAGHIVGYLIAYHRRRHLEVRTWLVAPEFRRRGIGRHLFVYLVQGPGSPSDIRSITLLARESEDVCHQFLKALGFRAITILWSHFIEPHEDGYLFSWWLRDDLTLGEPVDAASDPGGR